MQNTTGKYKSKNLKINDHSKGQTQDNQNRQGKSKKKGTYPDNLGTMKTNFMAKVQVREAVWPFASRKIQNKNNTQWKLTKKQLEHLSITSARI